jgi:branched-chain amino acid transport system substrate-binding protein
MRFFLLSLLSFILLQGCASSGSLVNNPWIHPAQQQQAQKKPDNIDVGQQGTQMPSPEFPAPAVDTATTMVPGITPVTAVPLVSAGSAIKVAILVPLSGNNADVGEAILNAAQLALFDIGGDSFELIPRDTKGTAAGAREAAESALHDGAQLILGPLLAEEVRAASPVVSSANINMVAFTTDWKQAGGNTFVMGFMPSGQVQRVLDFAVSHNIRRIGIIAPQGEYGDTILNAYNSTAAQTGISTVDTMRFQPGETNLSVPIQKFTRINQRRQAGGVLLPAPFDAVFIPAGGADARTVSNLLSYYDVDAKTVKRIGTGLWDDPAMAHEPSLNGGWFAAPDPRIRTRFENKYRDAYGTTPPRLASLGYDATALAAALARAGIKNGDTVPPPFDRSAITTSNGFAGIDGIFRFRPDGIVERGLAILEMRNGQSVVIDPAPKTFQTPGM